MPRWTDNMAKSMLYLYKHGLSASQSAAELNKMYHGETPRPDFTRNSIIGKWHRMGLVRGRPKKANCAEGTPPMLEKKRVKGKYLDIVPVDYDFHAKTIKLSELEGESCRWPIYGDAKVGNLRFCGEKRVKGAIAEYCEHHLARAYR